MSCCKCQHGSTSTTMQLAKIGRAGMIFENFIFAPMPGLHGLLNRRQSHRLDWQ
ncbi:unnamed protein product, partial [Nesidiocoris tenuis]